MYEEIFNHKIKTYNLQFGEDASVEYKYVEEFDNGTHSGGSMKGMVEGYNNDDFIKSKGYSTYFLRGRYNVFFSSTDVDYGYKFFSRADGGPFLYKALSDNDIKKMFDIHRILYEGGFGPKPLEILPEDDGYNKFIKIEKPAGVFAKPPKEWTESIVDFCNKNGIYRNCPDAPMEWEATKPTNCIQTDSGMKFIDIDYKWEYK